MMSPGVAWHISYLKAERNNEAGDAVDLLYTEAQWWRRNSKQITNSDSQLIMFQNILIHMSLKNK